MENYLSQYRFKRYKYIKLTIFLKLISPCIKGENMMGIVTLAEGNDFVTG